MGLRAGLVDVHGKLFIIKDDWRYMHLLAFNHDKIMQTYVF